LSGVLSCRGGDSFGAWRRGSHHYGSASGASLWRRACRASVRGGSLQACPMRGRDNPPRTATVRPVAVTGMHADAALKRWFGRSLAWHSSCLVLATMAGVCARPSLVSHCRSNAVKQFDVLAGDVPPLPRRTSMCGPRVSAHTSACLRVTAERRMQELGTRGCRAAHLIRAEHPVSPSTLDWMHSVADISSTTDCSTHVEVKCSSTGRETRSPSASTTSIDRGRKRMAGRA